MSVTAPKSDAALAPRNATEDAILAAARQALRDESYDALRMDGIARRAFVSRTTVYFYFPNRRAIVDRLIQQVFSELYDAATPYLEGSGEPRLELRLALSRVVAAVNANEDVLLLALRLSGEEDRLPPEWEPYILRMVGSAAQRIHRDQQRGIAPSDIPPHLCAQALCAMVERHLTLEIIRGADGAEETIRALSELWWRAVYATPTPRRS